MDYAATGDCFLRPETWHVRASGEELNLWVQRTGKHGRTKLVECK